MTNSEQGKSVGYLSHGQLAMMGLEAAAVEGIPAAAIGPDAAHSPASHVGRVFEGDYNNPDDVKRFVQAENIGSIVLDTDHVRTQVLYELESQGMLIVPHAAGINLINNRIRQKEGLQKAGLPLIPWEAATSDREKRAAFRGLGGNVIMKTAEGGFDGRSNKHISSEEGLEEALAQFNGKDVVIERFVNIKRELAMMLAQDANGGRALYPVVESLHEEGMLEYTFFPSMAGVSRDQQVRELGEGVLGNVIRGAALIGMETIETEEGELFINEIAGRPHNTGHMTIEACATSQFANLARIANGQSVGPVDLVRPGQMIIMRNLNGGVLENVTEQDYQAVEDLDGALHWYNKTPRARRKRGHITLFGQDRDQLANNAQTAIQAIHFFG